MGVVNVNDMTGTAESIRHSREKRGKRLEVNKQLHKYKNGSKSKENKPQKDRVRSLDTRV